jgi:hypothetical protein
MIQKEKNATDLVISNLSDLLNKGNAHVSLDEALDGVAFDLLGKKIAGLPYTIWQLADHIRIAQWDILEFSRNAKYISPEWPDGYWPSEIKPTSNKEWENCIHQIRADKASFIELLSTAEDIYKPFNYGNGQSLLKEALVLADHNSYHTGQIIILRRMLHDWSK